MLSEQIAHHVKEEEQRVEGVFSQARAGGLDMDTLGDQLAAEKARLSSTYEAKGPPTPKATTLTATAIGGAARG